MADWDDLTTETAEEFAESNGRIHAFISEQLSDTSEYSAVCK